MASLLGSLVWVETVVKLGILIIINNFMMSYHLCQVLDIIMLLEYYLLGL